MNVAFDPWIPVVTLTGESSLVSLAEIFAEGRQFADLAVRPHERVALMRLFLCSAHAALNGPKDYDDWLEVPERLPEAVQTYLLKWKEAFELFHPTKPWLQIACLSKDKEPAKTDDSADTWTPVGKLNFSFASGNNSTLFDHKGTDRNRDISLTETVLSMLTYQCFSTSGIISQVFWQGKQSAKTSRDAPCVPSSMIHALLRGASVLHSICLNLPTYEDIRKYYRDKAIGSPLWECMPVSFSDTVNIENATTTYLGRLVPLTRLMRLHSSGKYMLLGDGLPFLSFAGGFPPELTATVVVRKNGKKEEQALLAYNPAKAFWRQLPAMIVKRKVGQPGGPVALNALQEGDAADLLVAAIARNRETIVDTAEAVFHVPGNLALQTGQAIYEVEVQFAETLSFRLGRAVEKYRVEIDAGWEGRLKGAGQSKNELRFKLQSMATGHYWTQVEKNLPLLMEHVEAIGTDQALPTRNTWRKMLMATTRDAYRLACGQETPRHRKAFARGWKVLTEKRKEPDSEQPATVESDA